jgi:hypothetical protein
MALWLLTQEAKWIQWKTLAKAWFEEEEEDKEFCFY